jgi:hypothetical protein
MLAWFAAGNAVRLSDETPFTAHVAEIERVPGLIELRGQPRATLAFAVDALHAVGCAQAHALRAWIIEDREAFDQVGFFSPVGQSWRIAPPLLDGLIAPAARSGAPKVERITLLSTCSRDHVR